MKHTEEVTYACVECMHYGKLLVTARDAFLLAEIYARALRYEEKYRGASSDGSAQSRYTYHAWAPEPDDAGLVIKPLHIALVDIARAAGKPS